MPPDTVTETLASPDMPVSVSKADLFLGFLKVGLLGFGGVAVWARRVIVEERKWLTEKEYAAVLGLGQVLPGANTVNAAVMIGDRFQGALGALISVVGLMAMPIAILVALAGIYDHSAGVPEVRVAIMGTAAAAAGMVLGTSAKMIRKLQPTPLALSVLAIAFVSVGLLRYSLITVVVILAPISIAAVFFVDIRTARKAAKELPL